MESDGAFFGVCDGCAGTWLEEGVLTRLRSQPGYRQEDLTYQLSKRPVTRECRPTEDYYCPNCRAPMFGIQLGMLSTEPVSSCPECHAMFLERGRLGGFLSGR
jgi:Zn-finger nucleic acid-binding protein